MEVEFPYNALLWDEFAKWAQLIYKSPNFDETERDYKLVIGNHLRGARAEFLAKTETWQVALRSAFGSPNNLTPWQIKQPFLALIDEDPGLLSDALAAIWQPEEDLVGRNPADYGYDYTGFSGTPPYAAERIDQFIRVLQNRPDQTAGSKLNMLEVLGSCLLMAISPEYSPIYRADPMNSAYRLTGSPAPLRRDPPLKKYLHAVDFLVQVVAQCSNRGVDIRDPLDAQSIVWWIT